jgi:hypothetical protein
MNGRYTEEEFVIVLPQRLLVGLFFLCFAVVATMVAFVAALSLFLEDRYSASKIAVMPPTFGIASFAIVPIFLCLKIPIFTFGAEVHGLLVGPIIYYFSILVLLGLGAAW